MTLWAHRTEHGQLVVSATSGAVEVKVTEHPAHLRHFWGELGRLLDEAEKPAAAAGGTQAVPAEPAAAEPG